MDANSPEFLDWLNNSEVGIYIGYDRYGQFSRNGWVCCASYLFDDAIAVLVDNLSGGDCEAMEAGAKLSKMAAPDNPRVWVSGDVNPASAMSKLMGEIFDFYTKWKLP